MKRMFFVSLMIALGAAASLAQAADQNGNFDVKGYGLESCESYVAAKSEKTPLYLFSRSWLNGYLSAYNQLTRSTYDIAAQANLEALAAWLEAYCKEHRSESFVIATSALTAALHPRRLQEKAQASGRVAPSEADRETIQRIQQALKEKGYYTGTVDGLFGAGTRAALEGFQSKEQLNVTGQPDVPTLSKLLQ